MYGFPKISGRAHHFRKVAAVMGLNPDLHLVGNNFNNVGSATYIASLVAELPTGTPCLSLVSNYYSNIGLSRIYRTKSPTR
jgi:hypothetical protein